VIAALALLAACGGPDKRADAPVDPPADPSAAIDAGQPASPTEAGTATLTEAECDRFVDHVVILAARMRTGDAANNEQEIADTKQRLRGELREACLQVSRSMYECAMQAADQAGLQACQQAAN
jgi:metal-dependent amidase/aminoacylase/carboxypeptidase family protein